MTIARTVRPIHFEDFSGERLVFAYHLCDGWTDLAWFGQTGSDQGRDIIGTRPFDDRRLALFRSRCYWRAAPLACCS